MPIQNFTTKIDAAQTAGEIQGVLARKGVRQISTAYDDNGSPVGLAFTLTTTYGPQSYELPVNTDGVLKVFEADPKVPRSQTTREQAERTAWRNVKVWIEAQIAMIEGGLGTMDQVFFPYLTMRDNEGRSQNFFGAYVNRQLQIESNGAKG